MFDLPSPAQVTCNGEYAVERVERGCARDTFIEVQADTNHIHNQPHQPLLDELAREHPHSHDTQGRRHRVEKWNGAIGKLGKDEIESRMQSHVDRHKGHYPPYGRVAYLALMLILAICLGLTQPHSKAIDASKDVV